MESITDKRNTALQVGRIEPLRLSHVCQYAIWPCPKCCYMQGQKDRR